MRVAFWGTRGSIACPGPETARYGGNTSCVEVMGDAGSTLVLDAGTGIWRLGSKLHQQDGRVDVLLSHLHLDHVIGLGFFAPFFQAGRDVHVWGPASTTLDLATRLMRYLSPPFFPVHLRELPCTLTLHEVPFGSFDIGEFRITTGLVSHPGPTVGYRVDNGRSVLTYIPDHEPALGVPNFPISPEWTSGFQLAEGADLLIHDGHYQDPEYPTHVGWGHSSISQTLAFARLAAVRELALFHHDPTHTDQVLDDVSARVGKGVDGVTKVHVAAEGMELTVVAGAAAGK